MRFLLFRYESPEPDLVRVTVPAIGLRYARAGTRVNCRLFWRLCYVATESGAHGRLLGFTYLEHGDKATLRGPGLLWERVGFCTCVRLGSVFVYRRIGGVSTFRPSLKFF